MKNVLIKDRQANIPIIKIGNELDNRAELIHFAIPARLHDAAVFLHLRIGDYSDVIQLDDEREWIPERKHTQMPGKWTAWLEAMQDNDVVWHSDPFTLIVGDLPDQGEPLEQQYPTAVEEALKAVDTLTGVGAKAKTLPAGSDATVHMEEDANGRRIIVYGIPQGRDGGGGGEGGGTSFDVDGETLLLENGVLRVNTTEKAEADNTQPITSAGVYTVVGNINAILETI